MAGRGPDLLPTGPLSRRTDAIDDPGVRGRQRGRTITLPTPKEKLLLDEEQVAEVKPTALSLMPDGLLDQLKPGQVRDPVSYTHLTLPTILLV